MNEIKQEVKSSILNSLEELKNVTPGSKESVLITQNTTKLIEAQLKLIKAEDEIFNNDAEREKLHAETKKLKAELAQLENDSNPTIKEWLAQLKPDQVMNAVIILGVTGAAINLEKSGYILPERLVKIGMKLFGRR